MAAINTNIAYSASARKINVFASVVSAFHAWNDARSTRKSLNALTDRELADIGLCRGDIEDVATRTY